MLKVGVYVISKTNSHEEYLINIFNNFHDAMNYKDFLTVKFPGLIFYQRQSKIADESDKIPLLKAVELANG